MVLSCFFDCMEFSFPQFWSDYYFKAPQDALVKTLVRNRVDTFMYVQNTTVEALRLPYWRQASLAVCQKNTDFI